MSFRVKATLKDGRVLEVELADDETVTRELRFIERLRRARWGLPVISWQTVDGQRWCFSATEIVGALEVSEGAAGGSCQLIRHGGAPDAIKGPVRRRGRQGGRPRRDVSWISPT